MVGRMETKLSHKQVQMMKAAYVRGLAGYAPRGAGFSQTMRSLINKGLAYETNGRALHKTPYCVTLTQHGKAMAESFAA